MASHSQPVRGDEASRTQGTSVPATDDDATDESVDTSPTELTKSQAFDVLRNSRRREAIACLREHGGKMSVNELTTHVAAEEYDVDPDDVSSKQYKRVYTGLYQCHLDRADELGVVEFDDDENTVELQGPAVQLDPFLDEGGTPGSARVEFGVAIAVALAIAAGAVGTSVFGVGSTGLVAVIPIVALIGLALYQLF